MKKIVCELCESTEFSKENGLFVCLGCGTKYSPEDAKNLMKEVEGESATATTAGSVGTNKQIENLMLLAKSAFEARNHQEAEISCNKIIEIDASCFEAWLIKGQAVAWQSTFANPRIEEGATTMRKAVQFAPDDKKVEVAIDAISAIARTCNAMVRVASNNFANDPSAEYRDKYNDILNICISAASHFGGISDSVTSFIASACKEHKRFAAEQMNFAGVNAINNVRQKWNAIEHPDRFAWENYINWFAEIRYIFEDSCVWGEAAGEAYSELITRCKNRIIALKEPINSASYKEEWNSWSNSYVWVVEYTLSDSAKTERYKKIRETEDAIRVYQNKENEQIAENKKAAVEAKKKEEERKANAYWEEHPEEKASFETEKKTLNEELDSLSAINEQFEARKTALEGKRNEAPPSDPEVKELKQKLSNLLEQLNATGIFQFKIKQSLNEEIDVIRSKLEKATSKHKAKRNDHISKIDQEIAAINNEAIPTKARIAEIKARIAEINANLKSAKPETATQNFPMPKSNCDINLLIESEGFEDYEESFWITSLKEAFSCIDALHETAIDSNYSYCDRYSFAFINEEDDTFIMMINVHDGNIWLEANLGEDDLHGIYKGLDKEVLYRLLSDFIDGESDFSYVEWFED